MEEGESKKFKYQLEINDKLFVGANSTHLMLIVLKFAWLGYWVGNRALPIYYNWLDFKIWVWRQFLPIRAWIFAIGLFFAVCQTYGFHWAISSTYMKKAVAAHYTGQPLPNPYIK